MKHVRWTDAQSDALTTRPWFSGSYKFGFIVSDLGAGAVSHNKVNLVQISQEPL